MDHIVQVSALLVQNVLQLSLCAVYASVS